MNTARALVTEHSLSGLLKGLTEASVTQEVAIAGLALDSRKVQPGDLFLAVAGSRTHGLHHARQAVALGAAAVAWEPAAGGPMKFPPASAKNGVPPMRTRAYGMPSSSSGPQRSAPVP